MNPYEIRLSLLNMAQDIAFSEYYETNKIEYEIWHKLFEDGGYDETLLPEPTAVLRPHFTPFPSTKDILRKAEELKVFVDNG